jgi:hypothetical protein
MFRSVLLYAIVVFLIAGTAYAAKTSLAHLIDNYGDLREALGMEKGLNSQLKAENFALSVAQKALLEEIQQNQNMMRELANVEDKSEVGDSGTVFLDSVRGPAAKRPIPPRKP